MAFAYKSMNYKVGTLLEKERLTDKIFRMKLHHPQIASKVRAGQFILLLMDERSERVPFAVSDWSGEDGWIEFAFEVVGYSTRRLSEVEPGYEFLNVAGPLGNPVEVEGGIDVCVVAEGVGISEAYAVARAFREAGCAVRSVLGADRESELFYLDKVGSVSDEVFLCTKDGKWIPERLREVMEAKRPDLVYTVGKVETMKAVSELTKELGVRTLASLRPIMLCGIGICGSCRVKVGGKIRLTCLDGPSFDAHQIDFDELMARMGMFKEEEHVVSEAMK